MIAAPRYPLVRFTTFCLLVGIVAISGCGPTPSPRAVATPVPTQTLPLAPLTTPTLARTAMPPNTPTRPNTPAPTQTPTSDPLTLAMQQANQLRQSGNSAGAVAQYVSLLQQLTQPSLRTAVFAKLEEIGAATLQQADLQQKSTTSHADVVKACNMYQLALSAYAPIFKAPDRPGFAQDPFYLNAARVDEALIDCHLWSDEPNQRYPEVIQSFLNTLASYPDEPAITAILVPPVLKTYEDMVRRMGNAHDGITQSDVVSTGQALLERIGRYDVQGRKAADAITSSLAEAALCSERPFTPPNLAIGTSATQKVESCPFFGSHSAVEAAGLRATNPSEIWYVLDETGTQADTLQCTGYRTDLGKSFTYSYRGQSSDTYVLKEARSGKVLASKTYAGTAPKCVFTSCSVNTSTNMATCTGGEGRSTYDETSLIQWLKSAVTAQTQAGSRVPATPTASTPIAPSPITRTATPTLPAGASSAMASKTGTPSSTATLSPTLAPSVQWVCVDLAIGRTQPSSSAPTVFQMSKKDGWSVTVLETSSLWVRVRSGDTVAWMLGSDLCPAPPPTATLAPRRLANGQAVKDTSVLHGFGRLWITNGTDRDAVAVLSPAPGSKTLPVVLAIYVQAGQTTKIDSIRDGTYELAFTTGEDWDAATGRFTRRAAYTQFDDTFEFKTADTTATSWSVTLQPVAGGTATTESLNESEFPSLR